MSGMLVDVSDPENPAVVELDELGTQFGSSVVYIEIGVGVQGPPGQSGVTPVVVPVAAVSSKTITHSFPYPPYVRFIEADGTPVLQSWTYVSSTEIFIEFDVPFTGTIVLS